MNYFNKEKEFKKEIEPLLKELIMKCGEVEVPMFVSVCTKNSINETTYETRISSAIANGYKLTEDRYPDYINITRGGYKLVKKVDPVILDMDGISTSD